MYLKCFLCVWMHVKLMVQLIESWDSTFFLESPFDDSSDSKFFT